MNPMKRAFYAACNSIFANSDGLNEMALLSLQEAYSLSILMYAAPALHLSVKQTNELNVCWNMVFRRIFRYNKWESVRAVVDGCGRLDVRHLILLRRIQFLGVYFIRMTVYCIICFVLLYQVIVCTITA